MNIWKYKLVKVTAKEIGISNITNSKKNIGQSAKELPKE